MPVILIITLIVVSVNTRFVKNSNKNSVLVMGQSADRLLPQAAAVAA